MRKFNEYNFVKVLVLFVISLLPVVPISLIGRLFEVDVANFFSGFFLYLFGVAPCVILFITLVSKFDSWLIKRK